MMTLILGGSGSGKSAFAEDYLLRLAADKQKSYKSEYRKYYIATMQIWDEEMQAKVDRHHRLRQGKGFTTIEQPVALEKALETMRKSENTEQPWTQMQPVAVLLECMSNLVANEMFSVENNFVENNSMGNNSMGNNSMENISMENNSVEMQEAGQTVTERVLRGVEVLKRQADPFVIVTNNVFEDGIVYDSSTFGYIETLGRINERLAAEADEVIEVVAGIPQWIKQADAVRYGCD